MLTDKGLCIVCQKYFPACLLFCISGTIFKKELTDMIITLRTTELLHKHEHANDYKHLSVNLSN